MNITVPHYTIARLIMSPYRFLRILSKILPFNSAKNANRASPLLIGYSVAISIAYLTVFAAHFSIREDPLQTVNNVVLKILIACYLTAFFSVIISNYLNSKRYEQCLSQLELLDENLRQLGQFLQYKRLNILIGATLAGGALFFSYFIACDLTDVFLNYADVNYPYLVFVYVSFFMCFSSSIFIALNMVVLYQRYGIICGVLLKMLSTRETPQSKFPPTRRLEELLSTQETPQSKPPPVRRLAELLSTQKTPQSKPPPTRRPAELLSTQETPQSKPPPMRRLAELLVDLTVIANEVVRCFTPQIASIFLIAFVMITHDLFLLIKGDFHFSSYLNLLNLISIHLMELLLVVVSCHYAKLKEGEIVNLSSRMLSVAHLSEEEFKNYLECYFLIESHRFHTTIFGMFQPNPSTLLTVGVSIISYLVVLVQFSGVDDTTINAYSTRSKKNPNLRRYD